MPVNTNRERKSILANKAEVHCTPNLGAGSIHATLPPERGTPTLNCKLSAGISVPPPR